MIEVSQVFETDLFSADPGIRNTLCKQYGSKRSGKIYIVASSLAEAKEVVNELFTRNGYRAPDRVLVTPTHLVKKALRMVY